MPRAASFRWLNHIDTCHGLTEALQKKSDDDKQKHLRYVHATKPLPGFDCAEVWLDFQAEKKAEGDGEDAVVQGVLKTSGQVEHTRYVNQEKETTIVRLDGTALIKEVHEFLNLICVFGATRSGKSVFGSSFTRQGLWFVPLPATRARASWR